MQHPSVFDIFKVGIGPSSSHTMGPMLASCLFLEKLDAENVFEDVESIHVELYGSLALTGIGHCTDKAIVLGLEGERAESIDPSIIEKRIQEISEENRLHLAKKKFISFDKKVNLEFLRRKTLPLHANGLIFKAFDSDKKQISSETYYSIGGGQVRTEKQMSEPSKKTQAKEIPYPFQTGEDLLILGKTHRMSFYEIMLENEKVHRSEEEIFSKLDFIWKTMEDCIARGCNQGGLLPGRLKVRRRAKALYKELIERKKNSDDLISLDWVNLYALAVNEENASGSKIVTAPTNGAAGIMPALLKYYKEFCKGDQEGIRRFLMTSAAIGILYAKNASISGAEVGCQGEVGVACSMAAGGLAAALGARNEQIEQAAEIGMEHNLGLTCDPIGGLVQIPCIERNAMGAVKGINAARISMYGDGSHFVSLDAVMKTMMQTGADMKTKYKETSRGGLAVNIPEC